MGFKLVVEMHADSGSALFRKSIKSWDGIGSNFARLHKVSMIPLVPVVFVPYAHYIDECRGVQLKHQGGEQK